MAKEQTLHEAKARQKDIQECNKHSEESDSRDLQGQEPSLIGIGHRI